jgi:hypothetical protein
MVVDSGFQPLIDRAILLDMALRQGFAITLADVTMEEFNVLTVLWQERDKSEREDFEKRQRKLEQDGRLNARISARYQSRPV